jgi:DNA-binding transcriptional ArsR family regulator
MRPLYHPPLEAITVQGLLYALSDPVRVCICVGLRDANNAQNCATYLNVGTGPLPKSTLSQHFRILREAGLIRSERKGVELHNLSRCPELQNTYFAPMIIAIIQAYESEQFAKANEERSEG